MRNSLFAWTGRSLAALKRCTSGNAAMLVAIALPALIGGGGLAVDTAQWFEWKRELQFAVDQAALAGAWSRTNTSTEDTYVARAKQEYEVNLQVTRAFSTPVADLDVSLVNYNGGTANAVRVAASASKKLPFSSLLTGTAAVIKVRAQASVSRGSNYSACLIAVDPNDTKGAIDFNGNVVYMAGCGVAALSTSASAIEANGVDPSQFDPGMLVAKGGIDAWFNTNGYETHPYFDSLYDPYGTLTTPNPPSSQIPRTYDCVKGTQSTKANVSSESTTTYTYWKGANYKNAAQTSYSDQKNPVTNSSGPNYTIVSNDIVEGQVVSTTTVAWTPVSGSASNTIWEKATTVTTTTYTNVSSTTTVDQATLLPGTYSTIDVQCQTVFTGGIYVIDGGRLRIDGQFSVTGAGVLFVLKNGAYIDIAGGAKVSLTAMTATQLESAGLSASQASDFEKMLVYEDRNSSGAGSKPSLNGNASTVLNGTIYLPKSSLTLAGTATVTTTCLVIAAYTVKITGTADFNSFCPDNWTAETGADVGISSSTVKLVT